MESLEFSGTEALGPMEALLGLVSVGPTFLEEDAIAPPHPGGHGQPLKFLEFVSDGRCHWAVSHDPGASVTSGTSPGF